MFDFIELIAITNRFVCKLIFFMKHPENNFIDNNINSLNVNY